MPNITSVKPAGIKTRNRVETADILRWSADSSAEVLHPC